MHFEKPALRLCDSRHWNEAVFLCKSCLIHTDLHVRSGTGAHLNVNATHPHNFIQAVLCKTERHVRDVKPPILASGKVAVNLLILDKNDTKENDWNLPPRRTDFSILFKDAKKENYERSLSLMKHLRFVWYSVKKIINAFLTRELKLSRTRERMFRD